MDWKYNIKFINCAKEINACNMPEASLAIIFQHYFHKLAASIYVLSFPLSSFVMCKYTILCNIPQDKFTIRYLFNMTSHSIYSIASICNLEILNTTMSHISQLSEEIAQQNSFHQTFFQGKWGMAILHF